jgi:exodeoxyribonuclease VII large subunit
MNIAQFPLPIVTGIGHERDETIADMVAHKSLKTPTAVAEYLIDRLLNFTNKLSSLQERIDQIVRWIIQQQTLLLRQNGTDIKYLVNQYILEKRHAIKDYSSKIIRFSKSTFKDSHLSLNEQSRRMAYLWKGISEHNKRDLKLIDERVRRIFKSEIYSKHELIHNYEKSLELIMPEKVLSRGYSITYAEGKVIKSAKGLRKGQKIDTYFKDGSVESQITSQKKTK